MDGIKSRIEMIEGRVSEPEDRSIKIVQSECQRRKSEKKKLIESHVPVGKDQSLAYM